MDLSVLKFVYVTVVLFFQMIPEIPQFVTSRSLPAFVHYQYDNERCEDARRTDCCQHHPPVNYKYQIV